MSIGEAAMSACARLPFARSGRRVWGMRVCVDRGGRHVRLRQAPLRPQREKGLGDEGLCR